MNDNKNGPNLPTSNKRLQHQTLSEYLQNYQKRNEIICRNLESNSSVRRSVLSFPLSEKFLGGARRIIIF